MKYFVELAPIILFGIAVALATVALGDSMAARILSKECVRITNDTSSYIRGVR
jgi:hypothetical protein